MKLEIERKFLVVGRPWQEGTPFKDMEQGYLNLSPSSTVRVRYESSIGTDGMIRPTGLICVKGSSTGPTREEYEYEIPHSDAARMIYAMASHRISKRRYFINHGGAEWHVDQFLDDNAPLVLAEIELESEDQVIELPPWVGQEVTSDHRYSNANLAVSPWSMW